MTVHCATTRGPWLCHSSRIAHAHVGYAFIFAVCKHLQPQSPQQFTALHKQSRSQWGEGEVRQVVSPTLPFPLSHPSPFHSIQFSDKPVGGKVRSSEGEVLRLPPPTNTTMCIKVFYLTSITYLHIWSTHPRCVYRCSVNLGNFEI